MKDLWLNSSDCIEVNVDNQATLICFLFEKYYDPYIDSSTYLLRFLKCKKPEGVEGSVNSIEHTDKSFLSYLHQNNSRGLEVRTKDGKWFTFNPSASNFMAWSNGRIKACDHHVAVKEESQVRYSLGTFSYVTGMIETPKEFIDEAHPQQYKPFNHIDLLSY
ncbi:hypothetical protein EUGRSUZ_L01351 [Eucalyptus grandis]|uniref:Isopenicillin N synthase-like Fe(2+) 2OG dioxygenase domain-containing protein n=1 Tax=Eucalyptus grandis TaxID=71139 RepID=A0A058ZUD4_EUCGR|nr:hypothetical protein EUGRSUZ_L01351 [Eucalyptus grandis]